MGIFSRSRTVFSGGMCNVIGGDGKSVRNTGRDALNKRLTAAGHHVFDPQIGEESHGRPYDYNIGGPAEQKARRDADVLLYEIGDATMAGVTMLEVLKDVGSHRKVIVWLSGELDGKGRPQFKPAGYNADSISDPATKAHAQQMVKQGGSMRANLLDFTKGTENLRVVKSEDAAVLAFREFGVKVS